MGTRGSRLAFAAFVAGLVAVPFVAPQFWVTLGNYIGLYSIVALGLVLLTGVAGQTSFGQAAFVGLGAYATAYLTTKYGTSPWFTLAGRPRADGRDRAVPGLHHAADEGALPAARRRSPGASASTTCSATSRCSAAIPA